MKIYLAGGFELQARSLNRIGYRHILTSYYNLTTGHLYTLLNRVGGAEENKHVLHRTNDRD